MKLPSLKVSLPLIFLCWCLVGVQVHGTVLLAYPAMWAGVGLFFWGLHLLLKPPRSATPIADGVGTLGSRAGEHAAGASATGASATGASATGAATSTQAKPVVLQNNPGTDHHISTPFQHPSR
jgi:hypothetical protein